MEEQKVHTQLCQQSGTNFIAKRVVPKSTEREVVDAVLELVIKHGLAISNVLDIHKKVIKHMLHNATIGED